MTKANHSASAESSPHKEFPISIRSHEVNLANLDVDDLIDEMQERLLAVFKEENPPVLYANPACTITCRELTSAFYETVRRHQARWCQRARSVFGRKPMRKAKHWTPQVIPSRLSNRQRRKLRQFQRMFCVTGLLAIHGQPIPSDQWPKPID